MTGTENKTGTKNKAGSLTAVLFLLAVTVAAATATVAFFCTETSSAGSEKPRLIAHGGGFVEGYETTNSVEAVMQSIADGYTLIELDFDFSKDGQIIMIHDWDRTVRHYFGTSFDDKLTEKEFEKLLINGKFKTLTFKRLVKILDKNENIRIVTDVKGDNIAVLEMIAREYPKYVERMIPQIYDYSQYDAVKQLGYDEIILTLYAMPLPDYDVLLNFARTHALFSVTVGNEHEYGIKDLKYKLAKDGVTVYYHPVKDFETAERAMAGGVYGVYANRIIPADFEEPARHYYLLDEKAKLCDLTIPEKSFRALKNVKIKNGAGKERLYMIDGMPVELGSPEEVKTENLKKAEKRDGKEAEDIETGIVVENLEIGKHDLKLVLKSDGRTVAELDYLLWVGDSFMRIWDTRYAYRMEEFKSPAEMTVLDDAETVSDETRALLSSALIVKAGAYYGYCDGNVLVFKSGEEFLYSQRYINGAVISPLADCIKAVGADSVAMDMSKYIYVHYKGKRTMMKANTSFVSKDFRSGSMRTPIILYRNKTMAPGDAYKAVTDRDYVDNQEIMVLLPENVNEEDVDSEKIFEAAAMLFAV